VLNSLRTARKNNLLRRQDGALAEGTSESSFSFEI